MSVPVDCAGVLLAGGDSTRFPGGDKALVELDGIPLLVRAADALREAFERPPVVAARTDDRADRYRQFLPDADFVPDDPDFEGPLAGLLGAARTVETEWVFVAGCDMPHLSPSAIVSLAERVGEGVDAVAVEADGFVEPLHAFYRRTAVLDVAGSLPGDAGLRALPKRLPRVERVPGGNGALAASLENVNTPDDLDALRDITGD